MGKKSSDVGQQIGVAKLAELTGKSPRVIRQHADRGNIPSARRIAGVWIFDHEAVKDWKPKARGWWSHTKRKKRGKKK